MVFLVAESKRGARAHRMEERNVRLVGRVHREDLDLVGKLPLAAVEKARAERDAPKHRILRRLVEGGRLAASVANQHRER